MSRMIELLERKAKDFNAQYGHEAHGFIIGPLEWLELKLEIRAQLVAMNQYTEQYIHEKLEAHTFINLGGLPVFLCGRPGVEIQVCPEMAGRLATELKCTKLNVVPLGAPNEEKRNDV